MLIKYRIALVLSVQRHIQKQVTKAITLAVHTEEVYYVPCQQTESLGYQVELRLAAKADREQTDWLGPGNKQTNKQTAMRPMVQKRIRLKQEQLENPRNVIVG